MTDSRKQQRPRLWLWSLARLPWLIALGISILQAPGCGEDALGPNTPGSIAAVVVTPDTLTLVAGQSHVFSATARRPDGGVIPGVLVAWSSSDTAVAVVDSAGNVSARRQGQATIVASITSKHGQATVRVLAPSPAVARIEIAPGGQLTLRSGSMQQLAVRAFAADGTELFERSVAWSSSEPTIARVEPGHVLKAGTIGFAAITATVEGRTATAGVQVLSQVVSLDLDQPWLALALGEVGVIHAYARDEAGNLLNKAAVWSTSNPAVATVAGGAGRVTAIGYGNAILTATVEGVSARIHVAVGAWVERKLISADGAPLPATLFTVTIRDTVGTGTTAWYEARSARLRLLGGGPGYGRYEQRFDLAILRDGQAPEYTELVFPGTYTIDLAGNAAVRTINDEQLPAQRLPDGRIAITGTGRIAIGGQEPSSGMTFLYATH